MNTRTCISALLTLPLMAVSSCHRIADDDEVPEWLFDTYSTALVTSEGNSAITRYTFRDDNTAVLEWNSTCGGTPHSAELAWEHTGPNELTLTTSATDPLIAPSSDLFSAWIVTYSDECDALDVDGVRRSDGVRSDRAVLYRGAVCNATNPAPDGFEGEWDGCDYFWCDVPPVDNCSP